MTEVLSPPSATHKSPQAEQPSRVSAKRAPVTGLNASSVAIPLGFILTGIAALLAGSVWLVLQPDLLATYHYNQSIIAATHLFVLGWICTVIMGAMYQLVPVALETRLHSGRLARWRETKGIDDQQRQ